MLTYADVCGRLLTYDAVVTFGGQTPNNLAVPLKRNGATVLGTDPDMIDNAEDRNRHDTLAA